MKVLKYGKLPSKQLRPYRGTCSNCKCEVEVAENETVASYIPGCVEQMRFVICPTLGCWNGALSVTEYVTR